MPSLIPGVTGSLGTIPSAGQTSGSQFGVEDFTRMLLLSEQLKEQKRTKRTEEAKQKFSSTLEALKAGFPPGLIDPEEFASMVKAAGIPITSAEAIKAGGNVQAPPAAPVSPPISPAQVTKLGNTMDANPAGLQVANPPSEQAGRKNPGEGVISPGGIMTPGTGQLDQQIANPQGTMQGWLQSMGASAQMQQQGAAALQKLMMAAADPNLPAEVRGEATGLISVMTGQPVNFDFVKYMTMTPEEKRMAASAAASGENEYTKKQREATLFESLTKNPDFMQRFSGPGDAIMAARSVAEGGVIPSGIKTTPKSIQQITNEAELTKFYNEMGLSPSQAGRAAELHIMGATPREFLPEGLQSIVEKTLALKGRELDIEGQKVKIMGAQVLADLEKVKVEMAKEANAELLAKFNAIVEAKKKGLDIPGMEETTQELLNTIATKSGVKVESVKKWYQYITGGMSGLKFSPNAPTVLEGPTPGRSAFSLDALGLTSRSAEESFKASSEAMEKGNVIEGTVAAFEGGAEAMVEPFVQSFEALIKGVEGKNAKR